RLDGIHLHGRVPEGHGVRYIQQNGILVPQTSRNRQRGFITCGPAFFGSSGGRTLWTPADLAGPPSIWCNDTSTVTEGNPGHAKIWSDISGNGLNIGQTGNVDSQPLIVASGLDGKPILRFDGVDDVMGNASTAGLF